MRVLELWRYPIKSIGGEQLDAVDVDELGLTGDRGWGLVDEATGLVLTARRTPALLLATCRLVDGEPVTTTADGAELRTSADYSDWLGMSVRLERAGDEGGTYENPMDVENDADWISWQGPGGAWHDSGRTRISLVSTESLRDWDFRRFRANVLVDGGGEDEFVGGQITLGSAALAVHKRVARCVMVTRPQPGLERDLTVFTTINRERNAELCIGATVDRGGRIAVGDEVAPVAP